MLSEDTDAHFKDFLHLLIHTFIHLLCSIGAEFWISPMASLDLSSSVSPYSWLNLFSFFLVSSSCTLQAVSVPLIAVPLCPPLVLFPKNCLWGAEGSQGWPIPVVSLLSPQCCCPWHLHGLCCAKVCVRLWGPKLGPCLGSQVLDTRKGSLLSTSVLPRPLTPSIQPWKHHCYLGSVGSH